MKRLILGAFAVALGGILFSSFGPIVHAAENLIVNPAVESGDTQPVNWNFGSWGGTVATSSYSTTDGSTGKALGVTVTDPGSGDAKWYNDPVNVTVGKTYNFSDSYKSDAITSIVIRYTTGPDTYSYDTLTSVPASSTWTTINKDFIIPSGVTQVTIFHLIATNGQLWTDNFSLLEVTSTTPTPEPPVTTPAPEGDNLIANPSLETANGNIPAGWLSNSWGSNVSTFEYATSGNTGSRSGHVSTTAYSDGDAKWYNEAVNVTAGQKYIFKDSYKSTINTEVVVQFTVGTNFQYMYLGSTSATSNWSNAQFEFTAPTGATKASIFHLIAGVGDLWTDDYSLVKPSTSTPNPTPGTNENQILNPSAETSAGTAPQYWQSNSWGNNTAVFDYANEGQDGSRSLHVTVSNFVDGDAKWYHNAVTPGDDAHYKFSDYYKSTASSEVVIQYLMKDGTYTYKWLGTNPVTATWSKMEYSFIVPANVQSLTVFHVMAQNGELWTDNFSLLHTAVAENTIIPNNSVETEASATLPASWNNNSWGENNAVFEYIKNDGFTGNHSMKVSITSYVSGDAKWFSSDVNLISGANYRITDNYKSNVDTHVILAIGMNDGTTQYIELPIATASSTGWAQYSGTFTMPLGGVTMSIYHVLSAAGFLITDNFNIGEYKPTPFNRALISLSFDDSWEDNITTTLPLLNQYGYKTNQFYATTFIKNADMGEQAAIEKVKQFEAAGHEIGSHTITHPDLTTLNSADSLRELVDSKTYLQSIFDGPIDYFATPFGAYNSAVKAQIMANYTVHRTVDVGYNSKDNFDVSKLKVQNILKTTTVEELEGWITQAQNEGTWLILVFHRVANDAGDYDTTPAIFAQMLAKISAKNIPVVTFSQALAELQPQL